MRGGATVSLDSKGCSVRPPYPGRPVWAVEQSMILRHSSDRAAQSAEGWVLGGSSLRWADLPGASEEETGRARARQLEQSEG